MDRRTLLVGAGAAFGSLAGCSGSNSETPGGERPGERTPEPTPEPTPVPMTFPTYSFEEGDDGTTVVVLTLSNPGEERRDTTMTVVVENADGEAVTGSTDIDVAAGGEATYRVPVDVSWSWFGDNRNLRGVRFADAN